MNAPAIAIRGVDKSFRGKPAVRALDLAVPRGSLCGVLGPNGAGKSTTIRMILSILRPDRGSIEVLGGDALAAKDRIGYLPEERGLYRSMRVGEYLAYIAKLKGAPRRALDVRVGAWLEKVELGGVARRKCQELSKGMQQKVQLLAALIHEPELLILDEPFSGLDPVNAVVADRVIREVHARGATVLFSTHVLRQAEALCDRIFLIHRGVKCLDATLEEIRARFDPRRVRYEPLEALDGGARSLAGLPGVARVDAAADGAAYELALEPGSDAQRLMRELALRGPMRALELERVSLDEVFVRTVREAEGAEAADQAREDLERAQSA